MFTFVIQPWICNRSIAFPNWGQREGVQHRVCALPRRQRASPAWICAVLDPYEVLGLPRDADETAIKKAYRRAALRNHPDVNKADDAKEKFIRVQEAYAMLSDRSKRASYDRRSSSGFGGFGGFEDFFSGAQAASKGRSDSAEYARRWRQKNPMPEDISDSFGSIFNDIFSGVSSAVGGATGASPGIFEDFVEFLENQVDGWSGSGRSASGYDSDGSSSDDNLDEILACGNEDVLRAELDDSNFILSQLRAREAKLSTDCTSVEAQADEWTTRARQARERFDNASRDHAELREKEFREEVSRLRTRRKKVRRHINAQEKRQKRIEDALSNRATPNKEHSPGSVVKSKHDQEKFDVDEELEKLKKEMGLK